MRFFYNKVADTLGFFSVLLDQAFLESCSKKALVEQLVNMFPNSLYRLCPGEPAQNCQMELIKGVKRMPTPAKCKTLFFFFPSI